MAESTNITQLIESGPDAFTNLYDVSIIFPTSLSIKSEGDKNSLSVRVQDFPFPQVSMTPYTIAYKVATMKRFAPKITMTRKLSIPIRLDSNWDIYKDFKEWKNLYANDDMTTINFGKFSQTVGDMVNYGKIEVKAYDGTTMTEYSPSLATSTKKWLFYDVACVNVQEPTFTRESANPIILNVDFLFGVYVPAGETDPYSSK